MKRRAGQQSAESGVSSMGVQYTLDRPLRKVPKSKPHSPRRLSARQRKKVANAILSVLVVIGSAAFSVLVGDTFWPDTTAAPVVGTAALPVVTQGTAEPLASPMPDGAVLVWIPASGSRYHASAACSNMRAPREVSLTEAAALGLTPCQRCLPPT